MASVVRKGISPPDLDGYDVRTTMPLGSPSSRRSRPVSLRSLLTGLVNHRATHGHVTERVLDRNSGTGAAAVCRSDPIGPAGSAGRGGIHRLHRRQCGGDRGREGAVLPRALVPPVPQTRRAIARRGSPGGTHGLQSRLRLAVRPTAEVRRDTADDRRLRRRLRHADIQHRPLRGPVDRLPHRGCPSRMSTTQRRPG